MLQLKSKKKIYLYLIFLLILSTISNNNFSNFFEKTFKIKEIYVSGLSDKQNKKIQEKIKKLNYLNIFSVEKDKITKIIENNNLVEKYKVKIKYPDQLLINLYKILLFCSLSNPEIYIPFISNVFLKKLEKL